MRLPRRTLILSASALALLGGGVAAGATIAGGPITNNVVSACFRTTANATGGHTLILENTGHKCPAGYTAVSWNVLPTPSPTPTPTVTPTPSPTPTPTPTL